MYILKDFSSSVCAVHLPPAVCRTMAFFVALLRSQHSRYYKVKDLQTLTVSLWTLTTPMRKTTGMFYNTHTVTYITFLCVRCVLCIACKTTHGFSLRWVCVGGGRDVWGGGDWVRNTYQFPTDFRPVLSVRGLPPPRQYSLYTVAKRGGERERERGTQLLVSSW